MLLKHRKTLELVTGAVQTFDLNIAWILCLLNTVAHDWRERTFPFSEQKNCKPSSKNKKNKLFVFSGVLLGFRTQGNGRFGSPNWNFPFQFSHQKQILAPKYPIMREYGLLLSELKHLQVSNAFKNLRNVFVTQFWIDIDFYFFCISRNYR